MPNPWRHNLKGLTHCLINFSSEPIDKWILSNTTRYGTTNARFENGYEGYHHVGLHYDRIYHIEPAENTRPMLFGEIYGSYNMWPRESLSREVKDSVLQPFGRSPLLEEGEVANKETFVGIYPSGPMMFVNNYQCTYLITYHESVNSNRGATGQAFSPLGVRHSWQQGNYCRNQPVDESYSG